MPTGTGSPLTMGYEGGKPSWQDARRFRREASSHFMGYETVEIIRNMASGVSRLTRIVGNNELRLTPSMQGLCDRLGPFWIGYTSGEQHNSFINN